MNELIYYQIKILSIFIITGLCIGLLFDFFRIQRKVFKTVDFVTYIQDILFWILSGIIVIIVVMKYTNGEIRMYMMSGMVLGILIYMSIISKYIININTAILKYIIAFFNLLLYPFKKICKILKKSWKKKKNMV